MNRCTRPVCFAVLTFLLAFAACSRHSLDNPDWNNTYTAVRGDRKLQLTGHKKLLLDSTTSLSFGLIQYAEKENALVAFNYYDNTFLFFDNQTSQCIRKIRLSKDPVKGVGGFVNTFSYSFYFINYDSILLFNKSKGKLFLVDSTGGIKRSYSLKPRDKSFTQPEGAYGELLSYSKGRVYIPANPGRDIFDTRSALRDNLVAVVNLSDGAIGLKLHYPELYKQAFWGEHMHMFYTAFNPDKDYFVYSFPIYHYLYIDSVPSGFARRYAGSGHVLHVTPLSFDEGRFKPAEKKEIANLVGQQTYSRIVYDKYQHVYYRFVTSRVDENKQHSPFSIVILDEDLNKIGEQDLDAKVYQSSLLVVTREGLCLNKKNASEDELDYDIYSLKSH